MIDFNFTRTFGLLFLLLAGPGAFAATYYSKPGETNPNLLSNWTIGMNGAGANPPNFTSGDTFVIQSGHNYTTTADWSLRGINGLLDLLGIELTPDVPAKLQVDGTLTLNHVLSLGGPFLVILTSDAEDILEINGTVIANVQNKFLVNGSKFIINPAGKYILNHATAGNATTTFKGVEQFLPESIFEYRNHNGTDNLVSGIVYHHLVLNANVTKVLPSFTVNGDLTIASGNYTLNSNPVIGRNLLCSGGSLTLATDNANRTLTINADLQLSGGTFYISNAANNNRTHSVTVNGTFLMSAGTLDLNASNATSTNHGQLFVKGDIGFSGGTLKSTRAASGGSTGIYLTGTGQQAFTWSGGTMSTAANGIGRRFYYKTSGGPTGINETYSGTSPQVTISGTEGAPVSGHSAWPGAANTILKTFTLDNAAGVTLSRNTRINTKFLINKGQFTQNGYTLDYAPAASLEYGGSLLQPAFDDENPLLNGPGTLIINNADGVSLQEDVTIQGNIQVMRGVLDLGSHSINRNVQGGAFTLSGSAVLKIGGTNTFPLNYTQHSISASATVEYYGTDQQVAELNSGQEYGQLVLSGTGNKTLAGNVKVANDLMINTGATLKLASGQNITVKNQVLNSGDPIVLENNASLVQANNVPNAGGIIVKRNNSDLYRLDYTLWSSPATGPQTLKEFSPVTMDNRFYTYDTALNYFVSNLDSDLDPLTDTFALGKGYLIRMPDTDAAPGYGTGTSTMTFVGVFTGTPNNGNITVPVSNAGSRYNAIGNPYPSPISIPAFFAANTGSIDGVIYFWRKKNNPNSPNSSYAIVNSDSDFVGNGEQGADDPAGLIQTGQGFIVRALDQPGLNVNFTNAMRSSSADHDASFFRSAATDTEANVVENARVWLNLTGGTNGVFSQMLIAYKNTTTLGFDVGVDARFINDTQTSLNSLIGNTAYSIQARPPFEAEDIVPLQFKTALAGNYTIAVDHVDGLFLGEQAIYLKDNLTGALHNLKDGSYDFTSETGVFNDRFEIVYTDAALGVADHSAEAGAIMVYKEEGTLHIDAGSIAIRDIAVYDVRGRLVYNKQGINSPAAIINDIQQNGQLLIVAISTEKGKVNKKLMY